ncbi:MAG TPA: hypothetical protein PK959_06635 [Candidatus Competibacteraceae bacterium]|nr:hypothetical protein [Candidatus Competibacteraceae bacterium]
MSQLDTLMTQSGIPALLRMFGDDATYTPPYTPPAAPEPVSTWAIVRTGSVLMGQYGERLEPRRTAQLPKSAVPRPLIGATLVVNGITYRIDQQVDESDYFVTVAIR